MFLKIIYGFLIGCLIGFTLELVYRSIYKKRVALPKFVNWQMYGFTSAFLATLHFLEIPLIGKLALMFIFPTTIEFITGYLYLKIKGVRLWDYSSESNNFMGIISPAFSLVWFLLALIVYYFILPPLLGL